MSDKNQLTFDNRDEFQRRSIAEKLIKLLTSDMDTSPMVIDGGWGTGKTEFCLKLVELMGRSDSHHLIYVDAFKADHTDEPLLTILAEVLKLIPDGGEREVITKKVLPAVRFGLKAIAKGAFAHLLRQDVANVVDDFDKEIKQAAEKAINASVEAVLNDHIKAEESLLTLKTTLMELAAQKPIVIFVDELDRCRPDYAVSMLEVIKHTFAVECLQFVLITNTQQLKASINHCYGQSVDAQRYLDKFLKFTFKLPSKYTNDSHEYINASITHYENLCRASTVLSESDCGVGGLLNLAQAFIAYQNMSLREVETFARHLELYQTLTDGKGLGKKKVDGYRFLRFLGVFLHVASPEICEQIIQNNLDGRVLSSFLGETDIVKLINESSNPKLHQVLLVMIGQECAINSAIYMPSDTELDRDWQRTFQLYFDRGSAGGSLGMRTKIVREAIETVMLKL